MWRKYTSSSQFVRVVRELAFVLLVFVIACIITNVLVPLPFRVESARTYTGEQAMQISRTSDRRFWVGIPVLIVTGVLLTFARGAIRNRRGSAAAT
jgi:hypothetical protein